MYKKYFSCRIIKIFQKIYGKMYENFFLENSAV